MLWSQKKFCIVSMRYIDMVHTATVYQLFYFFRSWSPLRDHFFHWPKDTNSHRIPLQTFAKMAPKRRARRSARKSKGKAKKGGKKRRSKRKSKAKKGGKKKATKKRRSKKKKKAAASEAQ